MNKDAFEDAFWDLSDYVKKSEDGEGITTHKTRDIRLSDVHFAAVPSIAPSPSSECYAPIALPKRGAYYAAARRGETITHAESYTPSHPLFLSVSITHKSSEMSFYRLFREDARRYHEKRGKSVEVPYVPFFSYVPQFSQLNADQRAYYLYFRDKLETGEPVRADEAYFMLYVYELLNLTDVLAPSVVCERLADAWCAYRESLPRVDKYLAQWLMDLCLLYRLPPPTARLALILPHVLRASAVPEFYLGDLSSPSGDHVLALSLALSSYDYRAHKCGKENAELFDTHMKGALSRVLPMLLDGSDSREGEVRHLAFTAFGGSICAHNLRAEIELDYRPFGLSHALGARVTAAVKYIENALRAHLRIRNRLRVTELAEDVRAAIDGYMAEALPRHERTWELAPDDSAYRALYEASETGICFSRAGEIEQASWDNARLLGAEEERCDAPIEDVEEMGETAEENGLSLPAAHYLAALLEGKEKVTHEAHLVEEINAYAERTLGDVLLLPSTRDFGAFELITDYEEEAWSFIREKRQ